VATPRNLGGRIESGKRQYRKELEAVSVYLEKELNRLEDADFEPSSTLETALVNAIRESNRLRALLEVEE
jgi:post-segregation antitoxin (ccd killing protein)